MRIGSSVLVDLSSSGQSSPIEGLRSVLAGGEAIEGKIVGLKSPGRYEAFVGGQRLTLMPSKPLEVGSSFTARLVEGRLMLDFPQSAAMTDAVRTEAGVAVRTLPEVLSQMGLPTDAGTVQTLRALFLAGAGLSAEAVQLFSQHAMPATESEARLLAFAIQRGIPVDGALLSLLEKIFRNRQEPGQKLSQLLSESSDFARFLGSSGENTQIKEILRQIERSFGQIDNLESSDEWIEALRQGVKHSGFFREGQWVSFIDGGGEPDLPGRDIKSLLGQLQIELNEFLKDNPAHENQVNSLHRLARQAEQSIEQMQLGSHRAEWENRQIWILDIPVQVENAPEFLRLIIEGEAAQEGRPMELPIRVDFYVDLSYLGPIRVLLTLTEQGTEGYIFTDQPDIARLLNREIPNWLKMQSGGAEISMIKKLAVRQVTDRQKLKPPEILATRMDGLENWPRKINLQA